VAFILELLDIQEGDHVLNIRFGFDWAISLSVELVKEGRTVTAVEIISELKELGQKKLLSIILKT